MHKPETQTLAIMIKGPELLIKVDVLSGGGVFVGASFTHNMKAMDRATACSADVTR